MFRFHDKKIKPRCNAVNRMRIFIDMSKRLYFVIKNQGDMSPCQAVFITIYDVEFFDI